MATTVTMPHLARAMSPAGRGPSRIPGRTKSEYAPGAMQALHAAALWLALAGPGEPSPAAPSAPSPDPDQAITVGQLTDVAPPEQAAILSYGNRPIFTMRGTLMGRMPGERVTAAVKRLSAGK